MSECADATVFSPLFIACSQQVAVHSSALRTVIVMRETYRETYNDQLHAISVDLVSMTAAVRRAVSNATGALLDGDLAAAEAVIDDDQHIDETRESIEETALLLLATQAPVATDLRQLVVTLRMIADLERMGDLAVHVAKVTRMRVPEIAVPEVLRPAIVEMAEVADRMIVMVTDVIEHRDIDAAALLELQDDEMDRLHRSLFRTLLSDSWEHGVEPAVDIALLGRYYERIGDHAVSMARRIVFLVTGANPHSP